MNDENEPASRLCAGPFRDDDALPTKEELDAVPPHQRNAVRHRPSALITHGQQAERW